MHKNTPEINQLLECFLPSLNQYKVLQCYPTIAGKKTLSHKKTYISALKMDLRPLINV